MDSAQEFFDFAAEIGLTKHIGGVAATDRLAELCHIVTGRRVLDVGCGVGATPAHLARHYKCTVVGVDIREGMVRRATEVAERAGLAEQTEFRVADAQELPFDDETFDAVITESVTAFPADKQRAVNEYARVTRPGGYVGLNESTWLVTPPPPEVVAWAQQEVGAQVSPLSREAWLALLEGAGLHDLVAEVSAIDVRQESKGIVQRYGTGGILRTLWRALRLYTRNPAYRSFAKRISRGGVLPPRLSESFGYGIYVGRK